PRNAVEATAAGLGRLAILDRTNGQPCRVRVSSRVGDRGLSSLSLYPQSHHLSCRVHLRRVAHSRARRASDRRAWHHIRAAPVARPLSAPPPPRRGGVPHNSFAWAGVLCAAFRRSKPPPRVPA